MTTGELIKKYRKRTKLTQKQLAEKAGISVNSLSRYETGERQPVINILQSIAEALEVELSELLNWDRPIDELDKGVLEIYPNFNPKYGYISDMVNGEYPKEVIKANLQKDTVSKLGTLNALGQQKANEYITDLSEQEKYTKPDEE